MNSVNKKLMCKFFFAFIFLATAFNLKAQSEQQKIVYDLNSNDTAVHSTVLRQFNNVLKAAPGTELEVVCHGQAIYMLVKDKMYFEEKIKALKSMGKVNFKVCANSLKRMNVDQSLVSDLAEIVPVAILELAAKQKQGWSYIKAGN